MKIIENTTPVLFLKNNKRLKLMYITYGEDDSIYITFPRKKGYILKEKNEMNYGFKGEVKIPFRKSELEYESPKISFHPRDFIVHVRSSDGKTINKSYKLSNRSEDKNKLLIPFVQIVFPNNFDYFDEYVKEKYKNPLEIKEERPSNNFLGIEIFIHSKDCYLAAEDLPFPEKRKLSWAVKYTGNSKYTCSLFGSEIDNLEGNCSNSIEAVLHSDEKALIFRITPKD